MDLFITTQKLEYKFKYSMKKSSISTKEANIVGIVGNLIETKDIDPKSCIYAISFPIVIIRPRTWTYSRHVKLKV